MVSLKERPTPDLVVMFLTGVVGTVIIVGVIGIVLVEIYQPNANTNVIATRLAAIVNTLIGAIVGYVAGRGVTTVSNGGVTNDIR